MYGGCRPKANAVPSGAVITFCMASMTVFQAVGSSRCSVELSVGGVKMSCLPGAVCRMTSIGVYCLPLVARVAVALANCSGVVSKEPWPMPVIIVSPVYQGCD